MKAIAIWKEGMSFDGRAQGFSIPMDAPEPLGHDYGPGPKELVATALAGCAGMDVVGYLKKHKQFIDTFEVEAHVQSNSDEHPIVFKSVLLIFNLEGSIDESVAVKAVELSQTRYSGVSAMLARSVNIHWVIFLNGDKIHEGKSNFEWFDDMFQTRYEG